MCTTKQKSQHFKPNLADDREAKVFHKQEFQYVLSTFHNGFHWVLCHWRNTSPNILSEDCLHTTTWTINLYRPNGMPQPHYTDKKKNTVPHGGRTGIQQRYIILTVRNYNWIYRPFQNSCWGKRQIKSQNFWTGHKITLIQLLQKSS